MEYEKHAFISFSFSDNMPGKEGTGWVKIFHNKLKERLTGVMKKNAEIYLYDKKNDSDRLNEETKKNFPITALIVPILSEQYLDSECCKDEVKAFIESSGGKLGNKNRIFKVLKTPIKDESSLPVLVDIQEIRFYDNDNDTGRLEEYSYEAEDKLKISFLKGIQDTADEIRKLLDKLRGIEATGVRTPGDRLKIYLAETSADLRSKRDYIMRELKGLGHEILPDCKLPGEESDFVEKVESFLGQCDLSIHMIGNKYDCAEGKFSESVMELQYELARKRKHLPRIIWIPSKNYKNIKDKLQKTFVDRPKTDDDSQGDADLLKCPLPELRQIIHDKIKEILSANKRCIYLAECTEDLRENRDRIKNRLIENGYDILPDKNLPQVYPELEKAVNDSLEQCSISIHLIGEDYGIVPTKTNKSTIFIQNDLASKKSQRGELQRVVLFSPIIDDEDERQVSFIDNLRLEVAKPKENDYIFETAIKDMESIVFEKLEIIEAQIQNKRKSEKLPVKGEIEKNQFKIYLMCTWMEYNDDNNLKSMIDFFRSKDFDVRLPVFESEESERMSRHWENLKSCDAAVIYYGAGSSKEWLHTCASDIKKVLGYGRTGEVNRKALILAPHIKEPIEGPFLHDWLIIPIDEGFKPRLMDPFLEGLN